jgi:molybdopterin/thiamine biosynthesis adenylyltransferase
MNTYNDRFKDAPWYKESSKYTIMLGGVGGIGSNTLHYLSKSTLSKFHIYDDDIVSELNIGTQFFTTKSINSSKVTAITKLLSEFGVNSSRIVPLFSKIGNRALPISIAAFDNMLARKQLFYNWKNNPNKEIFIDGRLSATIYQIYVVTPGEREDWYEKTLFNDDAVADAPCTFKQTVHFAGLIGARITHIITNYFSNKYMKEDILNIPYFIEECGDPFIIKTAYENI